MTNATVSVAMLDAETKEPVGRMRVIHPSALGTGRYKGFVEVEQELDDDGRGVLDDDGHPVLQLTDAAKAKLAADETKAKAMAAEEAKAEKAAAGTLGAGTSGGGN